MEASRDFGGVRRWGLLAWLMMRARASTCFIVCVRTVGPPCSSRGAKCFYGYLIYRNGGGGGGGWGDEGRAGCDAEEEFGLQGGGGGCDLGPLFVVGGE